MSVTAIVRTEAGMEIVRGALQLSISWSLLDPERYPLLSAVDPSAVTLFYTLHIPWLLSEIEALTDASTDPEQRIALDEASALARISIRGPGRYLVLEGNDK